MLEKTIRLAVENVLVSESSSVLLVQELMQIPLVQPLQTVVMFWKWICWSEGDCYSKKKHRNSLEKILQAKSNLAHFQTGKWGRKNIQFQCS